MEELIDQETEDWRHKTYHTNRMDRVRHFFVDGLIIFFITVFSYIQFFNFFRYDQHSNKFVFLFFSVITILYYVVFEFIFSATPGKFLNRTTVVNAKGKKPEFLQILYRGLIRLLPITIIFLLLPDKLTLHDMLSNTYTVRKPKLKQQKDKAQF